MKCSFCEKTDSDCKIRKIKDNYFCPKHCTRWYRHSDMNGKSIYDSNDYELFDDHAEIILRNKECDEIARTIIDLEDVDRCKQYKWHMRTTQTGHRYVIASVRGERNGKIHLHRYVIGYTGDLEIDHINRNTLDNRKNNLRVVDHQANAINNGKLGVTQMKNGRWRASCTRNYKSIYIGTFDTKEEAVLARKNYVDALAS